MKKIIMLISLIFLTGCNDEKIVFKNDNYESKTDFYNIYEPYKNGVSSYYISSKVGYLDIENSEEQLIQLSLNYYDNKRYYLQDGQYLKVTDIKKYLSNEFLNKKSISIDYILEKNFVSVDGKISGISFGLIFNENINSSEVIKNTQNDIALFIEDFRKTKKMSSIDIVIGAYFKKGDSSFTGGNYEYVSFSAGEDIGDFKPTNFNQILFPSDEAMNSDQMNYGNFNLLLEKIKKIDDDINVIGKGFYVNSVLKNLEIDIDLIKYNNALMTAVSSSIAKELAVFKTNINVEVRCDNKLYATINYNRNDNKSVIDFY